MPNLSITNGKAFFHFNRKLCMHKIDQLVDSVPGLRNQTDEKDVDPSTNGDQVACEYLSYLTAPTSLSLGIQLV